MTHWIRGPLLAIALSIAAAAQGDAPNRGADADKLVEAVMQFPTRIAGLSVLEHQGRILGDAVAVAVARRLRLKDLQNSDTATRVLDLLTLAFSEPAFIQADEDKKPGVTLLLLDHLAEYSPDGLVRQHASELIIRITNK